MTPEDVEVDDEIYYICKFCGRADKDKNKILMHEDETHLRTPEDREQAVAQKCYIVKDYDTSPFPSVESAHFSLDDDDEVSADVDKFLQSALGCESEWESLIDTATDIDIGIDIDIEQTALETKLNFDPNDPFKLEVKEEDEDLKLAPCFQNDKESEIERDEPQITNHYDLTTTENIDIPFEVQNQQQFPQEIQVENHVKENEPQFQYEFQMMEIDVDDAIAATETVVTDTNFEPDLKPPADAGADKKPVVLIRGGKGKRANSSDSRNSNSNSNSNSKSQSGKNKKKKKKQKKREGHPKVILEFAPVESEPELKIEGESDDEEEEEMLSNGNETRTNLKGGIPIQMPGVFKRRRGRPPLKPKVIGMNRKEGGEEGELVGIQKRGRKPKPKRPWSPVDEDFKVRINSNRKFGAGSRRPGRPPKVKAESVESDSTTDLSQVPVPAEGLDSESSPVPVPSSAKKTVALVSKSGKLKQFECEYCGKKFAFRHHLRAHTVIHTGERPFACSFCHQTFTQQGTVIIHERIHTGERPYKCEFCSKACISKCALRSHQKLHR